MTRPIVPLICPLLLGLGLPNDAVPGFLLDDWETRPLHGLSHSIEFGLADQIIVAKELLELQHDGGLAVCHVAAEYTLFGVVAATVHPVSIKRQEL